MYNPFCRRLATALIFFVGSLMLAPQAFTQVRINLPYSIYGVGELRFNQYFQNMGMGGISQGYRSNLSVNDVNPASYTATDSTSFVFETTLFSHFYEQRTNTVKQQADYISLGNFSFKFPVTPWWSFAAGLKPYSAVGYQIREDDQGQPGAFRYVYEGSGGLNQLFIGNAFEPVKGLSIGMNASYIFGKFNHESSVVSDSVGVYLTNLIRANDVTGWMFGFGMQYQHIISDNRWFVVGATFGNQQDMDVSRTETLRRMLPGVLNYDTIYHNVADPGTLTLPAYYGVGLYGRLNRQWSGGIDYQRQNWESYQIMGSSQNLNNSQQVSLGVGFSPVVETYSSIFHSIRYSAGIRYGQAYFQPQGEPLNEFGIAFGLHIPVRWTFSGIKLGFEYSQRGSTTDHLMQENFYRINFGINIYERWFVRRRFF